jgi:hypothetical protein
MPANAVRELLDEVGNVAGAIDAPANANRDSDFAGGRARGLFDPRIKDYRAHDIVAFNGSEWRAIKNDPGPLPGPGWMLGAKGTRGRPGERGKDGVHVSAIELLGYTLAIDLSNGERLCVNLLPALELFERERRLGARIMPAAPMSPQMEPEKLTCSIAGQAGDQVARWR